jgi:hypothetical protein
MTGIRIREIPLAVFVLFFRINLWYGDMRAHSAAAGVSIIELAFFISCGGWLEIGLHRHFDLPPLLFGGVGLALYLLNDHFLVGKKFGTKFEMKSKAFSKQKKVNMYVNAGLIVAAVACFCYVTIIEHGKVFSAT